jgi:hypothetical protein
VNVEDINVGDEVQTEGWFAVPVGGLLVTHIEGSLVVGRTSDGEPWAVRAEYVVATSRPKKPLGYEKVFNGDFCRDAADALADLDATHVVTHWSDGTCTLDTIAAFREAHQ